MSRRSMTNPGANPTTEHDDEWWRGYEDHHDAREAAARRQLAARAEFLLDVPDASSGVKASAQRARDALADRDLAAAADWLGQAQRLWRAGL